MRSERYADSLMPDLEALAQAYGLWIVYVFGSRGAEIAAWVRGQESLQDAHSASDVDVGALSDRERPLSVRDKVCLALALEDMLGVQRVDLVALREADPFLAANIVRGERLYAQDPYLADEYELYILRRAGDLEPLERERMALILGEETYGRSGL